MTPIQKEIIEKRQTSLADHLKRVAEHIAATTGSHKCGCGARISRNKPFCLKCMTDLSNKADSARAEGLSMVVTNTNGTTVEFA